MPVKKIEVRRTVETTREESAVVEVDVPSHILDLDDGEELHDWVEQQVKEPDSDVSKAFTDADWDHMDEDEDITYDEVYLAE